MTSPIIDQPTLDRARAALTDLRQEVAKAVVGQDSVVTGLVIALLCRGHVLLEGVPGVAKTLLVRALAAALEIETKRVQFTPDLMPGDITGSLVYDARTAQFSFSADVFTNLLLADEINRTPPKTQAALLEAMEERQVSVDGVPRPLPDPFVVAATQNPVEYEALSTAGSTTRPVPPQAGRARPESGRRDRRPPATCRGIRPAEPRRGRPVPRRRSADLSAGRAAVLAVQAGGDVLGYVVDVCRATRSSPSLQLGVSPAVRPRCWRRAGRGHGCRGVIRDARRCQGVGSAHTAAPGDPAARGGARGRHRRARHRARRSPLMAYRHREHVRRSDRRICLKIHLGVADGLTGARRAGGAGRNRRGLRRPFDHRRPGRQRRPADALSRRRSPGWSCAGHPSAPNRRSNRPAGTVSALTLHVVNDRRPLRCLRDAWPPSAGAVGERPHSTSSQVGDSASSCRSGPHDEATAAPTGSPSGVSGRWDWPAGRGRMSFPGHFACCRVPLPPAPAVAAGPAASWTAGRPSGSGAPVPSSTRCASTSSVTTRGRSTGERRLGAVTSSFEHGDPSETGMCFWYSIPAARRPAGSVTRRVWMRPWTPPCSLRR